MSKIERVMTPFADPFSYLCELIGISNDQSIRGWGQHLLRQGFSLRSIDRKSRNPSAANYPSFITEFVWDPCQ